MVDRYTTLSGAMATARGIALKTAADIASKVKSPPALALGQPNTAKITAHSGQPEHFLCRPDRPACLRGHDECAVEESRSWVDGHEARRTPAKPSASRVGNPTRSEVRCWVASAPS